MYVDQKTMRAIFSLSLSLVLVHIDIANLYTSLYCRFTTYHPRFRRMTCNIYM